MVFVLVLFLMVIVSAAALAFISRVSADLSSARTRLSGIQADYLAESAAGHAIWRLLNEPSFPADNTVYYMHSFAGGRYGYKARRHSETTFATIATVGAFGNNTVHQSYVVYVRPQNISYDCPGLVGYWPLDEAAGGYTADTSGNDNDGTLTGMDPATDWGPGRILNSLDFDGINDHVLVNHHPLLSQNTLFTLSAWINNKDLSGRDTIISKGYSSSFNYRLGTSGDELEFSFVSSWGNLKTCICSGLSLLPNQWFHVAASYDVTDNNRVRLYKNGEPVCETSITLAAGESMSTNNGPLYIGNSPDNEYWQGKLDEVRIYDTALTLPLIKALYLSSEPGCNSCNPDYSPTSKISEFPTSDLGAANIQGLCYLHESVDFKGVPAPSGGALLCINQDDNRFYMISMTGTLLTTGPAPGNSIKAVSFVTSGAWANHLVTVDSGLAMVNYSPPDFSYTGIGFMTSSIGAVEPAGIGFIETTQSGTYDGDLALIDRITEKVYITGQDGSLKSTINATHATAEIQHVAHLPMTDKVIVSYDNEVRIYQLSGSQSGQYDTTVFGSANVEAVVINPLTCDHILSDKVNDTILTLNRSPGNTPPIVSAGPDQILIYPILDISLSGTVSDDGLPVPPASLTTIWKQISGPEGVVIDDPSNILTTAVFPGEGDYLLRLFADDGDQVTTDDISVFIAPAGACFGSYEDQFNTSVFNGSNGSLDWSENSWIEIGESDGPAAGDVQITNDLGDNRLQLRDNDNGGEGVEREMDLSGAGSATLSFKYRRGALDKLTDYVKVELSPNGASGPWTEIMRLHGPDNDDDYQDAKVDITAYTSGNTRIRLITSPTLGSVDYIYIDDLKVTCIP